VARPCQDSKVAIFFGGLVLAIDSIGLFTNNAALYNKDPILYGT
jgi:hypothetical protein